MLPAKPPRLLNETSSPADASTLILPGKLVKLNPVSVNETAADATPVLVVRFVMFGPADRAGTGDPHELRAEPVFRANAVADEKSVALSLLSVHPFDALKRLAALEAAFGVGPEPSKQLAVLPKPT